MHDFCKWQIINDIIIILSISSSSCWSIVEITI